MYNVCFLSTDQEEGIVPYFLQDRVEKFEKFQSPDLVFPDQSRNLNGAPLRYSLVKGIMNTCIGGECFGYDVSLVKEMARYLNATAKFTNDPLLLPICGFERFGLNQAERKEKLAMISLILVFFFITNAYETKIIALMSSKPRVRLISTLQDVLDSGTMALDFPMFSSLYSFINHTHEPEEQLDGTSVYMTNGFVGSLLVQRAINWDFESNQPRYRIMDERFAMGVAFYSMPVKSALKHQFRFVQKALFETGIMNHCNSRRPRAAWADPSTSKFAAELARWTYRTVIGSCCRCSKDLRTASYGRAEVPPFGKTVVILRVDTTLAGNTAPRSSVKSHMVLHPARWEQRFGGGGGNSRGPRAAWADPSTSKFAAELARWTYRTVMGSCCRCSKDLRTASYGRAEVPPFGKTVVILRVDTALAGNTDPRSSVKSHMVLHPTRWEQRFGGGGG
ncbi:conserved hypothetical protein [Culex quinquefasciatus]|uniref:Uncharacterized protein n=1 Tax=Culex quinquefasciatus TaxID=7176 RepID=B0WXP4_CULQU|nr:conserved hypothetical protein [Culex quinquefasciatus]|eukprot:XP_001862161.1 conserved hypothetical protein [Culex quinquefasciatus]